MSKLDNLIHSMLTENTGRHFLDSGGAYGRNWQRNQGKSVQDYIDSPSATLEVSKWERDGKENWDLSVTLSLFHHLRDNLHLDPLCDEFNALEVGNWNGEYHGTDQNQCDWLTEHDFTDKGDGFNSYNWSANFTQVVQGEYLERDGEQYVLLQIHGGCDVRGGYTNAKLFKIDCDDGYFLYESAGFSVESPDSPDGYLSLTWSGEWINSDGQCGSDVDLEQFAKAIGEGIHAGDQYAVC